MVLSAELDGLRLPDLERRRLSSDVEHRLGLSWLTRPSLPKGEEHTTSPKGRTRTSVYPFRAGALPVELPMDGGGVGIAPT